MGLISMNTIGNVHSMVMVIMEVMVGGNLQPPSPRESLLFLAFPLGKGQ